MEYSRVGCRGISGCDCEGCASIYVFHVGGFECPVSGCVLYRVSGASVLPLLRKSRNAQGKIKVFYDSEPTRKGSTAFLKASKTRVVEAVMTYLLNAEGVDP